MRLQSHTVPPVLPGKPAAMLLTLLIASIIVLGLPAITAANPIGMNVIAEPLTRERIATLPKNQQKAWLEYLERSEK